MSASMTPNKFPLHLSNPNAFQFEQESKHPIDEVQLSERMSTLTVAKEVMDYHSLPETKVAQSVDISRPHSDTDITTLPFQTQEDDITPNRKTSLHVKGGEKLVLEEPIYEGLSFNVDSEVDYAQDKHQEEETCDLLPSLSSQTTHIPDNQDSPTTPVAEASPFLMLDGPTQAESTGISKNVIGSGVDLSFYLKHG